MQMEEKRQRSGREGNRKLKKNTAERENTSVKIKELEGRFSKKKSGVTLVLVQPALSDCSRSFRGMPKRNRKLMKVTHV